MQKTLYQSVPLDYPNAYLPTHNSNPLCCWDANYIIVTVNTTAIMLLYSQK